MLWGRICFCHGRTFTDSTARSAHELAKPRSKAHRQKLAKAMMENHNPEAEQYLNGVVHGGNG